MKTTADTYLTPLPWHRLVWKSCYDAARSSKLHHALLLQSASGSGKTEFIKAFAKLLFCMSPVLKEEDVYHSCNQCSACLWYQAGTHPNYYEITPTLSGSNKPFISIDQIRGLTESLQSTAVSNTDTSRELQYHTVVVIDPVDVLQVTAVHALLKTLEEPTPGVLFILASAKPYALAPTIRSRCQAIVLSERSEKSSLGWLKEELLRTHAQVNEDLLPLSLEIANGMPLKALSYLKEHEIKTYQSIAHSLISLGLNKDHPGEVVQQWSQYPIDKVLDYLMLVISQLTRLQVGETALDNTGLDVSKEGAIELSRRITADILFQYWDKLNNTRYEMSLYTLNPTIALEMLAYSFSSSCNFS